MKPPTPLPYSGIAPAPILLGVLASWVPISAPAMIGIVTTALVYVGLVMLARFDEIEPADAY